MARSVWKGPFVESYVLKKAEAARELEEKILLNLEQKINHLPQFVGLNFGVHNGQKFIPVLLRKIWSVINLENLLLLELIMDIQLINLQREVK